MVLSVCRGLETILFSSVAIGDGETGWAIDILGRIWFSTAVTPDNPAGNGIWWQVCEYSPTGCTGQFLHLNLDQFLKGNLFEHDI